MTQHQPSIFISHSSQDRDFALKLADALTDAGYRPWVDVEAIPDGSSWAREIEKAVTECGALIVVMSKPARDSEWVEREILLALDLHKPLLIARLDDAPLPIALINRQFTDFRKRHEPAFKRLIAALGKIQFHQPPPPPTGREAIKLAPTPNSLNYFKYMEQLPNGVENARIARSLFDWAKDNTDSLTFSGRSEPAFHAHIWVGAGGVVVFSVRSFSKQPAVEVPLQYLMPFPPYDQAAERLAVLDALNRLSTTPIEPSRADRRPTLPLAALATAAALDTFTALMRDVVAKIRGGATS
ncbi:MAG: toll/interleukin-1 receptor domain-containing protein [Chloroflexi bacterium]|uniref:toll/interleukin-1 receptor domain-containing protein n=1 Tax=Candidatus Flexifilum breve TaxID=3140694 RepID=UPI003134D657|nr:toll/interleukin-1 receptor domain-containing protein [Chloroflexota bacterium]